MISISRAEHLPSFRNRGPGKLENGLFYCYSCDVRDERVTASARATYQNCLRQKEYFWYFKNPLKETNCALKLESLLETTILSLLCQYSVGIRKQA